MRFSHLLIAVDLSEHSEKVLSYARDRLAPLATRTSIITVFYDWMPPDVAGEFVPNMELLNEYREAKLSLANKELEAVVTSVFGSSAVGTPAVGTSGASPSHAVLPALSPTYQVILEHAAENGVDLIAVGTHGRGALTNLFIGSTVQRLLKSTTVPILVVP
jgi:nucleotide-binding universal stress UspA family protein